MKMDKLALLIPQVEEVVPLRRSINQIEVGNTAAFL